MTRTPMSTSQTTLVGFVFRHIHATGCNGLHHIHDRWHHGPFVTVACWRSHQTCTPPRTQTAAVRDLSELARQLLTNSKNLTRNHPKNTLTISLVSSHPPATGCGQRGCMGVALLSLEIKRWRTAGMPMARMWQLLPSWDALPQQWFPGYQVREKPPVDLLKWMASAKPLTNPPPHIPLHPHYHHEFTWDVGKQVDCTIILVEIEPARHGPVWDSNGVRNSRKHFTAWKQCVILKKQTFFFIWTQSILFLLILFVWNI